MKIQAGLTKLVFNAMNLDLPLGCSLTSNGVGTVCCNMVGPMRVNA